MTGSGLRNRVVLERVAEHGPLSPEHAEAARELGFPAVEVIGPQLIHGDHEDEPGPVGCGGRVPERRQGDEERDVHERIS